MAKISLDRLKKKYGAGDLEGENYSGLISTILATNQENVSRRIGELGQTEWNRALAKITGERKSFVIPSLEEVLPKRSVFTLKAAQNGNKITDTLRDRLTADLRAVLSGFTPKTAEQTYVTRRGTHAGQINPRLVKEFKDRITQTFQHYTKNDPKFGIPSNVKSIAVTEVRSAVGMIKREFADQLTKRNSSIKLWKRWIHNANLSKVPRHGHLELNKKAVPNDQQFTIRTYKKKEGRWKHTATAYASGPHAPELPASEVIGCNCDLVYEAKRK